MAMEPISPNLPTDHNLDVNAMLGGRPHLELVHDLDVVEEIAQPYYFNDNDELVVPEDEFNEVEPDFLSEPEKIHNVSRKFKERLTDTLLVNGTELNEEGSRTKHLGAMALASYTQVVDRSRPFVWLLPPLFERVMTHGMENGWENYQTVSAGMAAVGGAAIAINAVVGKSFSIGIKALPETKDAVEANHPAMVGSVRRAMNGFPRPLELQEKQPQKPEAGYDVNPYETQDKVIGKVGLGVLRGLKTSFLFGSTGQVGIAEVDGHSSKSVNRRLMAISAESGAVYAGLAGWLGTLIVNSSPETAETIKNTITNKWLLTGLTAGAIGWGILGNWGARRKEVRLAKEAAHTEQEILDDTAPNLVMA